jgi:glycine cleavage system H lipoate-binding protein
MYFIIKKDHKSLINFIFIIIDLTGKAKKESKFIVYDELVEYRRLQAQRSVLIEIQSYKSCSEVYKYCSQFGKIQNIFHYTNSRLLRV